ncbi:hypothetical protein BpHYR1_011505 [Brachionus plicatilis]|uniref:Uncharacterized protein n=1 Tax=Brachionus plicatilis TaxID=10195 RepID=A0A3M7S4C1_BRAPC|nr:hypothetical protein BpHYR1_011505 [Brachionus plicatilis]
MTKAEMENSRSLKSWSYKIISEKIQLDRLYQIIFKLSKLILNLIYNGVPDYFLYFTKEY